MKTFRPTNYLTHNSLKTIRHEQKLIHYGTVETSPILIVKFEVISLLIRAFVSDENFRELVAFVVIQHELTTMVNYIVVE